MNVGAGPAAQWALLSGFASCALLVGCDLDRSSLRSQFERDGGPLMDAGQDAMDAGDPDTGAPMDAGRDAGLCPRPGTLRELADVSVGALPLGDPALAEVEGGVELRAQPHRRGVLLAKGFGRAVLDEDAPSTVVTEAPTGVAYLAPPALPSFDGFPPGLGLRGDEYTATYIGEIFLEAGTHRFRVEADDFAVLEVGEGFQLSARLDFPQRADAIIETDGWYELRIAHHDRGGPAALQVEHAAPGAELAPIDRARVRLSPRLAGREVWGWPTVDPHSEPAARRLDFEPTNRDFGASDPGDLELGGDVWTARWVGRVALPNEATLFVRSDDGHRLWVDGVCVGAADDAGEATYGSPWPAGLHDLVVELTERSEDAELRLTANGAVLRPEAFEPRTRFGGDVHAAGAAPEIVVSEGTAESADLELHVPATSSHLELSAIVSAPSPEGVRVVFTGPDGMERPVVLSEGGHALAEDRYVVRHVVAPIEADGTWAFEVRNAGSGSVTLHTIGAIAHVAGETPHPEMGTFTTTPTDLGGLARLHQVTVDTHTSPATSVEVAVRVAATAARLERAAFQTVAEGRVDPVLVGEFAQVRVTLRGPGHASPRVEGIQLLGEPCL